MLNYAGPQTQSVRRPLFIVSARVARRAAVVSILLSLLAWWFFHDHMFRRDYNPHWWVWVTPVATAVALPLAGIALLRDRSFRRPAWLVGSLAAFLAGSTTLGMLLGSRGIVCGESADRVKCASNMRQVYMALTIYASAHNGALPPDLATLLTTTDITPDVFVCPLGKERVARGADAAAMAADMARGGRCSYIYRPKPTTA